MPELSDNQLMLLEQLTYLDKDVRIAAGLDGSTKMHAGTADSPVTVQDILSQFDDHALKKLNRKLKDNFMTGREWKGVIEAIQNDPQLKKLELIASDTESGSYCYRNPDEPGRGYVTFRGTASGAEWADNVDGLNATDTPCQKQALDFVESLPCDSITVTGHSKGGNKSQYVTLLCDRVDRCIAMDGQGFSKEFFDKYWAEIQKKGSCIKNYCLTDDYVNILMYTLPGTHIYQEGQISKDGGRAHSPHAFFRYDWRGDLVMGDAGPQIYPGEQVSGMIYLHEFTCFVINNMPNDHKEDTIELLRGALAIAMGKNQPYEWDGKVYRNNPTTEQGELGLTDFLCEHPDELALVVAYLAKYVQTRHLPLEEVNTLLTAFGLDKTLNHVDIGLSVLLKHYFPPQTSQNKLSELVSLMLMQMTGELADQEKDPVIGFFLSAISSYLLYAKKTDLNLAEIWAKAEAYYNQIGSVSADSFADGLPRENLIRDFTSAAYGCIIGTISELQRDTFSGIHGWENYSGESWFSGLAVTFVVNGVNSYCRQLTEVNQACKAQIEQIFESENQLDASYAEKLRTNRQQLRLLQTAVSSKTAGIRV